MTTPGDDFIHDFWCLLIDGADNGIEVVILGLRMDFRMKKTKGENKQAAYPHVLGFWGSVEEDKE